MTYRRRSRKNRIEDDRRQAIVDLGENFTGFVKEPYDQITSHTPFRPGLFESKSGRRYCTRSAKIRHSRSIEVNWVQVLHAPAVELFALTDDSITVEMLQEMQEQGLISSADIPTLPRLR